MSKPTAPRLLAALLLMTLLAPGVRADEDTEISFHAGKMSMNIGKAATGGAAKASGSAYGLRYLHQTTPFAAFGLDADFLKPADSSTDKLIENGLTSLSVDSASLLAVVRLGPTEGDVRPNFLFGMGVHLTSLHLEAAPKAGFGWADSGTAEKRTLIDSGGTGLAVKLQGGADYAISDRYLAGAFLAFNFMGAATYEATDQARALGLGAARGSMTAITGGICLSARF